MKVPEDYGMCYEGRREVGACMCSSRHPKDEPAGRPRAITSLDFLKAHFLRNPIGTLKFSAEALFLQVTRRAHPGRV